MNKLSIVNVGGIWKFLRTATQVLVNCCCGGCCICGDEEAGPGEDCYVEKTAWLPEDKRCNNDPYCCCGSEITVVFRRLQTLLVEVTNLNFSDYDRREFVQEDIATFVLSVSGDPCVEVREFSWSKRTRDKYFLAGELLSDTGDVYSSVYDGSYGALFVGAMGGLGCRPEAVAIGQYMLDPVPFADMGDRFITDGCSGTYTGLSGRLEVTWASSSSCKHLLINADGTYNNGTVFDHEEYTGSSILEVTTTSLNDDCCGDEDGDGA